MSIFETDYSLAVDTWEHESASSTSSHEVALDTDEQTDALRELYLVYMDHGKQLFGASFNQFGDFGTFACYVYKHMIP